MIQKQFPLDFLWQTQEPFLFCAHHHDFYPSGNAELAVETKFLKGRDLGQDFQVKDGFRMYHGESVPGFPVHPHRGFETITIVRKGFADHADSMGAAGRYGQGDVQWMTAGRGVQHSEMFPLLNKNGENTLELFQIWLNLPRAEKMTEPHFKMFWHEKIPKIDLPSNGGSVTVIAGALNGVLPLAPPPSSWAAQNNSDVAIWLVKLNKDGRLTLPPAQSSTIRTIYLFEGKNLSLDGKVVPANSGFIVDAETELHLHSEIGEVELLVLQARPIGEPVFQHGPFVMNSRDEIIQTFKDYEKTQFGGWPWPRHDMVHGAEPQRFAKFPDGNVEKPTS